MYGKDHIVKYMPAAFAAGFFSVPLSSAFCILALSEKIRKKIRVFEICGILRAEEIRGVVNMQERKFISLAESRPDLAAEWNHKKNGILKPEDIAHKSGKKVWWIQYDKNPVNDKLIKFEWEDTVIHRSVDGRGNPFKSGHKILKGYNDLQTVNPELAKQWHPTKNGNLKPADVTAYSRKKVWWLLSYDDAKTGKHFDFEWKAAIYGRHDGNGCPYLNGRAVWKGFNDLQTVNPEFAKLWHPTKKRKFKANRYNHLPWPKNMVVAAVR